MSVKCEAITKSGAQCRAVAMHGTDPPRCNTHSKTPEELREHVAKMGRARQHQRRVERDASEDHAWVAEGITKADILRVCSEALGATFHAPGSDIDGTPDWSARLTGAATLLACFPRSLRSTPDDAKALLQDILSGTKHEQVAKKIDPAEAYKALRAEWFDSCARYDELRGLYAAQVPVFMLGPGETRAEVMKAEAPSFEGWTINTNARSDTHAIATTPEGEEVFVPRESAWASLRGESD